MPRTIRSPPQSSIESLNIQLQDDLMQHTYDSAPDLTTAGLTESIENMDPPRRERRKRGFGIDELQASIQNINKVLSSSMAQQESKLSAVMSTISEIKEQNNNIQSTINFLSEEYHDIKKEFIRIESERKDQYLYIKTLETKIEDLERTSRATGLELRNIKQREGETKKTLLELIMKIGEKIKVSIQPYEVKEIFRFKSKAENKPIIVEFTSVIKKQEILEAIKQLKRANNGQLESSVLGIQGPSTKVFISETLTTKNKRLFTLARDFVKSHEYKYCWTSYGYIYIRRGDGQPAIRINSEGDLDRLKSSL
ncbi:hypothetical protein K1T71_011002 [Dendrolimus kikuchii]|uniref:Uncharacterized protein n=1 Tax=Dendrolimus kikuchii TaxID=765133 RepID=A0ACC1CQE8_9NEOP|nr:hypothetical protein K1T71_011002 [Dendrolimus kikuchii]